MCLEYLKYSIEHLVDDRVSGRCAVNRSAISKIAFVNQFNSLKVIFCNFPNYQTFLFYIVNTQGTANSATSQWTKRHLHIAQKSNGAHTHTHTVLLHCNFMGKFSEVGIRQEN